MRGFDAGEFGARWSGRSLLRRVNAMDTKPLNIPSWDAALERLIDLTLSAGPVETLTDKYFSNTRRVVEAAGDCEVTYAVFLRRRSIAALEPVVRLIARLVPEAQITRFFADGEIVPSERKMFEVTGPMSKLSEVETLILQKTGFPCISANNAYEMCRAMPNAAFIDMHARHASGAEMNMLAAYGAAVGSEAAKAAITRSKALSAPRRISPRRSTGRRGAAGPCRIRWLAMPMAMCCRR